MSRILLIDDEPELLETVAVLLKSEGYDVVSESEGLEAMNRLQSTEVFDLMVVDLRMAPIDGVELITVARKECPTMDVVVLSAYLDDEMLRKVHSLGVATCIRKPFTIDEVLDPVREIFLHRTRGGSPRDTRAEPPVTPPAPAPAPPPESKPASETSHEGWIL
ncbi:MAG: response regulator [Kiritimatiellae bacterium]|nr:response regulator [Kiritimatiellia bacterium]